VAEPINYGFLSSTPPTPCGVATFTTALGATLVKNGSLVSVVRITDTNEPTTRGALDVVGTLVGDDPSSIDRAIRALNKCDVAVLQHEYGLYAGADGDAIVKVLEKLKVPTIAILHTVKPHPTPHQAQVLNAVIRGVDAAVVMSETALAVLHTANETTDTPVVVIPHGALVSLDTSVAPSATPTLLTWGLLGPGKGIEWMIDAMVLLRDRGVTPHYVVAGATHPKVLAREGDVYRESLVASVAKNGLSDLVHFDNDYRDLPSLQQLIHAADIVVLPYDSQDQATSGVLVDAIAAGVPVVATDFPHAKELLSSGAGVVVAHKDGAALAQALYDLLTSPPLLSAATSEARRVATILDWETVAVQYQDLTKQLLSPANS
jgi:glycosyltransferase involved in cell wall biosynthesis